MLSGAFLLCINLIFLTKPHDTVDPNSKIIACLLQQLGYAVKPIIHRTILRDAFNLVCGCPEYCHLKCWLLINLHCHSNCFLLSLPGHWINYETVHTSSQQHPCTHTDAFVIKCEQHLLAFHVYCTIVFEGAHIISMFQNASGVQNNVNITICYPNMTVDVESAMCSE